MHTLSRFPRRLSRPRAAPSAPRVVSAGLLADYRLAGLSGSAIPDSSGNGYDASRTTLVGREPTFTSAGLQFGPSHAVPLPIPYASIKSVQFVTTVAAADAGTERFFIHSDNTGGVGWQIFPGWPAMFAQDSLGFFGGNALSNQITPVDSPQIIAMTMDNVAGYVYWNDYDTTQCLRAQCNHPYDASLMTGTVSLGSTGFSGLTVRQTMTRALFYSTTLTHAQILQNNVALKAYGAAHGVTIPGTTSYTKRVILALGDSITAGVGTNTTTWLQAIVNAGTLAQPVDIMNYGITAIGLADIASWAGATCDAVRRPLAPSSLCVIFAGTNSLGDVASVTPAIADLNTIVSAARGFGFKVILMPMISRNAGTAGPPVPDATKNAYNAAMASTFGALSNVTVVPPSAYATLTADGADTNLTYFQADQVHPTNAGASVIGIGGVGSDTGVLPYINAAL